MIHQGMIRYRTVFAVAVAAGLLLAAAPVSAQIYVAAGYLPTFTGDTDFEIGAKPAARGDFEANRAGSGAFDFGIFGLRAAAGYRLFFVRLEGEVSYRQLKLSDYEYESYYGRASAFLDALNESIRIESGELKALNLMVNAWLDIDVGGGFRPYVGGGVGGGQLTLDTNAKTKTFTAGAIRVPETAQEFPDTSAWAFAFQVGGGLAYQLVEGLTVSLGYRLSGTTAAELAWNAKDSGTDEVLRAGTLHHSIDLGVRYELL